MSIVSVGAGLLAGILSTLSPCVLPLLPLVIAAATSTHRSGAFWLAGGVAVSFTAAGLFIATVGFAIGLDEDVFRRASAILLILLGAALLSTTLQARLGAATGGLSSVGDRLIRRAAPTSGRGQLLVGVLLGLVWSPCAGPTLGAASLLAAQRKDLGECGSGDAGLRRRNNLANPDGCVIVPPSAHALAQPYALGRSSR